MKLSISSCAFNRFPLEKQFEMAAGIGFDGIELSGLRPYTYAFDLDQARIDRILELKSKYRLEIPMYAPELLQYPFNPASPLAAERRDALRYLKRSVDVAKGLGTARVLVVCGHAGCDTDRNVNFRNTAGVLREVCSYAGESGVDLLLKPLPRAESNTAACLDAVIELMGEVDSPHLKGTLDSAAMMANREPMDACFEKFGLLLDYIHWGGGGAAASNPLFGAAGRLDPAALFTMAARRGYDGWVGVVAFDHYTCEPELHAACEHRLLKAALAQLG